MGQRLVILGTGGSAADVLDIVDSQNAIEESWAVVGFLDDARPEGTIVHGYPVLGRLQTAGAQQDCLFINSIGSETNHAVRDKIISRTGLPPERFATLAHATASVSPRARISHGVYFCAGCVVAGGVSIEEHATIHPGVILGHDSTIGAYSIVSPGAVISGFVRIGRGAYIGANAVVRQRIAIGDKVLVGMGAVVTKDVYKGIVVGNPARPHTKSPTVDITNTSE